ncbi:MAG: hypothetical protein ACOCP2_00460 [Halohasta sp.]
MQPTRRRYLAVTGVGIGAGVAGCLSSGSNVTYPEVDAESESDSDSGPKTNESTNESAEGSNDDESVESINSRLAEETAPIYDELRWFETEYADTMLDYKGELRDVYAELKSLLETLAADGRIEAEQLREVETLARDVAGSVNEIPEPQFTNHADFQQVNDDRFPVVERFRKREDWDRVERELDYIARIYGNASTDESIQERYSPNPVDNRLYEWVNTGDSDTMLEVRHISDDPEAHDDEDQRLPGHGVYVVDDSSREIEYLDRPLGGPRRELLSRVEDTFSPFSETAGRSYRLFARLHETSDSGGIDPTETDSINLFVQQYIDREAAAEAFDAIMADKTIEDTEQWGDETWNKVLYDDDSDRHYTHFLRADSLLFVVAPSETPWEERDEDDEDDNSWTDPLDGTWLNP